MGCLVFSGFQGTPAQAEEPSPALSTTLPSGDGRAAENQDLRRVWQAMQHADAPTLVDLYKGASDPIVHVWAAMALERVHFNLDAATADAKVCEQSLFDSRPAIALSCGQFQSGNLRLAGRASEADALERELIQRYQNHRVNQQLAGMRRFEDGQTALPALSYDVPAGDITLPLKEGVASPTFKAEANGHPFELMLDTGASDLVLGEEDARNYGVKPLDEEGHTRGWLSTNVPTQKGLLDELSIGGGIVLHNVPVTIVPTSIALMGANLAAPLGTLHISQKSLQVLDAHSDVPACDTPMLVSSGLWGNNLRLLPQLLINDQPRSVMLDSGASRYLLGTKAALDEVTVLHRGKVSMKDIGGNHAFANMDSAKVKLTIAGQPIDMRFVLYTDSSTPHPITLGAGALRDMDFLLDFRRQHMCFLLHPDLR